MGPPIALPYLTSVPGAEAGRREGSASRCRCRCRWRPPSPRWRSGSASWSAPRSARTSRGSSPPHHRRSRRPPSRSLRPGAAGGRRRRWPSTGTRLRRGRRGPGLLRRGSGRWRWRQEEEKEEEERAGGHARRSGRPREPGRGQLLGRLGGQPEVDPHLLARDAPDRRHRPQRDPGEAVKERDLCGARPADRSGFGELGDLFRDRHLLRRYDPRSRGNLRCTRTRRYGLRLHGLGRRLIRPRQGAFRLRHDRAQGGPAGHQHGPDQSVRAGDSSDVQPASAWNATAIPIRSFPSHR